MVICGVDPSIFTVIRKSESLYLWTLTMKFWVLSYSKPLFPLPYTIFSHGREKVRSSDFSSHIGTVPNNRD